jgi:hypothetical protein
MGNFKTKGKRRQITFRIGPIAQEKLKQHAELFNMKPSEYAKAVLYRDLGVFSEPLDRRRRKWQRKKRQEEKDVWSENREPMEESGQQTAP